MANERDLMSTLVNKFSVLCKFVKCDAVIFEGRAKVRKKKKKGGILGDDDVFYENGLAFG